MRLDTMLHQNGYALPEEWHKIEQSRLKMEMTKFMMKTADCQEFVFKLATYSDYQFGQMCVRLANKDIDGR